MAKQEVNVGMIGYAFMGKAHSFGYRNCRLFYDTGCVPVMKVICGRTPDAVESAAAQYGWQECETDWRKVVERDDIDVIDVSTPGNLHRDMSVAAAEAGKHVFCEKPLANSFAEAVEMMEAAEKAGVVHMCGYNYRTVPAVALARKLIEEGKLGEIYHFRAQYLQDWIMDPDFPLVWRLQKPVAGSGPIGDLGAHITDLALFLVGDISRVSACQKTFIKERPLEVTGGVGDKLADVARASEKGEVTVEDASGWLADFACGAMGVFEVTRFAGGRKNYNTFEINGAKGSLRFCFEDMNYLEYWSADDPAAEQGFKKILVTNAVHKYFDAFWPDGHIIGYGETFVSEVAELMEAIEEGRAAVPSFADGVRCQAVLEAIGDSCESGRWTDVPSV